MVRGGKRGEAAGAGAGGNGGAVNKVVGTTVHEGIVSVRIYMTGERAAAEAATADRRGGSASGWGCWCLARGRRRSRQWWGG